MEIPVFTVDAFTNVPFKGNPAAVCLIENVSIALHKTVFYIYVIYLHSINNCTSTV